MAKGSIVKFYKISGQLWFTAPSPIHGMGNFAIADIPENTNLGIALIKKSNTGNDDDDYQRFDLCAYMNHSDHPNIKYIKKDEEYYFVSIKDIVKNEELTIDYGEFDF